MDADQAGNAVLEAVVTGVLSDVPVVGNMVSALTSAFWPHNSPDIWTQVQAQVEEVVDAAVAQEAYNAVQNILSGFQEAVQDYVSEAAKNDPANTLSYFSPLVESFDTWAPTFQNASYQVALLPLFAQFANMNLTVLRDGAMHGVDAMGVTPAVQQLTLQKLQNTIFSFSQYALQVFQAGLSGYAGQSFEAVNLYVRTMTLSVLDYRDLWRFFDPVTYPPPQARMPMREVYSNQFSYGGSLSITPWPSQGPTQPITGITVWSGSDTVDGIEVTYPTNGGPGGISTTGRMGTLSGGTQVNIAGLAKNPVAGGKITVIDKVIDPNMDQKEVMQVSFVQQDGTSTVCGVSGPAQGKPYGYASNVLSSINIGGPSNTGTVGLLVFGFRYPGAEPNGPVLFGAPFVCQGQTCFLTFDQLQYASLLQLADPQDLTKGLKPVYQTMWKSSYDVIAPSSVGGVPFFYISKTNRAFFTTLANPADLSQGTKDVWDGDLSANPVCVVPFTVGSQPYFLVGYSNGNLSLTTLSDPTNIAKGPLDVWTESGTSALSWGMTFQIAGSSQPYFLTERADGTATISTLANPSDPTKGLTVVWTAPKPWGKYVAATPFIVDGDPYFLFCDANESLWLTKLSDPKDPTQGTFDIWKQYFGNLTFVSTVASGASGSPSFLLSNTSRDLFLVTFDPTQLTNGPQVQWAGGLPVSTQ